jgi:hypothetical protein
MIEEASQVDNSDILFKALKMDKGVDMMETLVKVSQTNTCVNYRLPM